MFLFRFAFELHLLLLRFRVSGVQPFRRHAGKADGIKIVPLSEVATNDDFINIKNVSAENLMSAHRVPPQKRGMMPNNTLSFGDVVKAAEVFVRNELTPIVGENSRD